MDEELVWEDAFYNQVSPLLVGKEVLVGKVGEFFKSKGYDFDRNYTRIISVSRCLKGVVDESHDYDEYYYLDGNNPRTVLSDYLIEALDQEFPREEDWALFVSCEDCDEGEELGADDPRHHFDLFEFDMDTETFTCKQCGKVAQQEYYDHSKEGD
jgi:hypothetical protein